MAPALSWVWCRTEKDKSLMALGKLMVYPGPKTCQQDSCAAGWVPPAPQAPTLQWPLSEEPVVGSRKHFRPANLYILIPENCEYFPTRQKGLCRVIKLRVLRGLSWMIRVGPVWLFTQSRLTLCNPMDCSTPGSLVHHRLLEFVQTHVHWVGDAIQPSLSLSSPSPPAFSLSQHHSLF